MRTICVQKITFRVNNKSYFCRKDYKHYKTYNYENIRF